MNYPLISARLSIQPLTQRDLATFVDYRSDPDIARFQSWDTPYSKTAALELIESQPAAQFPPKGDWLQLGIHLIGTSEHIGDLAVHQLDESPLGFEIGYTIAKQFQGMGYAKEAAAALIEFLIQESGAKRFIATPDSRNLASIKLLEALGFVQRPEKSWGEYFKGENVTVEYFELVHAQQVNHKHQGAAR